MVSYFLGEVNIKIHNFVIFNMGETTKKFTNSQKIPQYKENSQKFTKIHNYLFN